MYKSNFTESKEIGSRKIPGIISYVDLFSSKILAYATFFAVPLVMGLATFLYRLIFVGQIEIDRFFQIFLIFLTTSLSGTILALLYSKKAPILKGPPNGWAIQLNTLVTFIIGGSYLFGGFIAEIYKNYTFKEVFFILGTIIAYIISFVIYFSFTTVGRPGYILLSLTQPVTGIILYSFYTEQVSILFFIKAILFFCTCAFLFAIPYAKNLFQVNKIYKEATGLGGYEFIRAFILSMMTEGNDEPVENLFDRVGVKSDIKIQYLFLRNSDSKQLKGLFIIPFTHFGPFKTCGSSDLPEQIYQTFGFYPGITVYHTTNDHTYNLTTQQEVNRLIHKMKGDVMNIMENSSIQWKKDISPFSRNISKSAKVLGLLVDNVPMVFLTRHPLPSDDIKAEVGEKIREGARFLGFKDVMIIDSHNSIIEDEILIKPNSAEAKDLIKASRNYLKDYDKENKTQYLYGVARDPLKEYSEKQGIGKGGMVVHLFKNRKTNQKTALIHFDGNNAYVNIRSYILNTLQNLGIEKGEITTSDSHTVARQFTSRGYSPLGDRIKLEVILEKLKNLIKRAERDLEPVEFYYDESVVKETKIWGEPKYFDVIMNTLEECIRVSQRLLTFSLIIPTFFSLILLFFYYNIYTF
jgi:putative membrane protein